MSDDRINCNFLALSYSFNLGQIPFISVYSIFLKVWLFLHLKKKWNSSSTSFKSQNLHILFSFLILVYLPFWISRKWLYTDINGICPKLNEYYRYKKLQLILSSSQIMRFTVPFVIKLIAMRKVSSTAA
jgi:hypothetical protein